MGRIYFGSGLFEVLFGFGEFDLLEAVGCEDGDLFTFDVGAHRSLQVFGCVP